MWNFLVSATPFVVECAPQDGLAVPLQLQLQVLEPDHLDTGKTGDLPGGGFVLQGVEFEPWGGGARTGCSRCIRAKWRCSGGRR